MKSYLGNFYRHLAIFSGHTGYDSLFRAVASFSAPPATATSKFNKALNVF